MSSNGKSNDKYIYQLPYAQHTELCGILDRDAKWRELAGRHMKFDMNTIVDLQREDARGKSPTGLLLTMWGQQNHTIVQLFVLLSKMHHYQAMTVLKPLVDSKYHPLIHEGEENMSILFKKEDNTSILDSRRQEQNGNDGAGPGGGPLSSNGTLDKNLNVWGDNLNQQDMPHDIVRDKMFLPEAVERKDLNTAAPSAPSRNDRSQGNIPRDPMLSPQVLTHNMPANTRSEVKETNLMPRQERKTSCASDVSSVAETIPLISHLELEYSTNGWDKNSIIGKGGFGTVFKGNWNNTWVAIKKIEQRGAESTEGHQARMGQLLQELRILNSCRHDNILPLYGVSTDGIEPCLVSQFMPNGSLEDRLLCRQGSPPLSWIQRHNVARGTARGLQFLHVKPFIHGDIKSANILLDKNLEPRIGDFGLARDGPQGHYTHMKISRIHGTMAYLPVDFLRNKQLSTKVDTYSFGVVVYELATGLRAYDDKRPQKLLKEYIREQMNDHGVPQLSDRRLGSGRGDLFVFDCLVKMGRLCVCDRARDRPEMEEVLKCLEAQHGMMERRQYLTPMTLPPSPASTTPGQMCPPHLIVMNPEPWVHVGTHPMVSPMASPMVSPMASPLPPVATPMPPPVPHVAISPAVSPVPIYYPSVPNDPLPDMERDESHSSIETSEEIGPLASAEQPIPSPTSSPCKAVVPLLSALGVLNNEDTKEAASAQEEDSGRLSETRQSTELSSTGITAKGKHPLCVVDGIN